jgi:hypothetical protein
VVTETNADTVRTHVMILSFGVEKSLKALRRHVDRVPPSRGHNILDLLADLNDETRTWVWALSSAKPRQFEWALSANQDSFEEWRYASVENTRMLAGKTRRNATGFTNSPASAPAR